MSADPVLYPKLALSRQEAAQSIGLGIRKFDELCADPQSGIPRLRIGKRVLFPADLLNAWVEQQASQQAAPVLYPRR